MRILASNPDNIGDFVLRQPMYSALAEAGHDLLLVVRSAVAPLVATIAPKARALELTSDPYYPGFDAAAPNVQKILAAAHDFAPDLLCIAPYQRTLFEELLVESLGGVPAIGMAGILYRGYIGAGLDCESRIQLQHQVAVAATAHELRKNERLCGALLERSVKLPDPVIAPGPAQVNVAAAELARIGLQPGSYWVACVGHNQYTAVRNWPPTHWAEALTHAVNQRDRRLLFIGSADEREATEEIRELMGEAARRTENLCGSTGSLDEVVGLIHLSAGYIGRDTGPMHVAAALGKPVLAVFGGGTWPRFTPAATRGAVLTVSLPCAGCDWICHLPESYCVKRVPVRDVIGALDALEAGAITGVQVQQLRLDETLWARIVREGAKTANGYRRRLAAADANRETALRRNDTLALEWASRLAVAAAERDSLWTQREIERQEHSRLQQGWKRTEARWELERRRLLELISDLTAEGAAVEGEVGQARDMAAQLVREMEQLAVDQVSLSRRLVELEADRVTAFATIEDAERSLIAMEQVAGLRAFRTALGRIVSARGRRLAEAKHMLGFALRTLKAGRG